MKHKNNMFTKVALFTAVLFGSILTSTGCSSSVRISDKSLSLFVDDTYTLRAESTDEDALVLWKSSDNKVAVVRRGKVTAVGKGECDITAYDDNGAINTCHVTVDAMNVSISHTSKEVDLHYLHSFTLMANSDDNGEITWSSSDESIATVNGGVVTCYETGETTITAYRKGGKAKCSVTVIDSDRPEDYYVLEKGQNAVVAANPGRWYYWPNGSSTVSKAVHQNSGFVSHITKLEGNGVYYRYQPDFTGSFSISFKIMLNVTTQITGKKTINVTENEWADYSFTGIVNPSEPFFFTIKGVDASVSNPVIVNVKDIVVTDGHAGDYYSIEKGNNATVVANPGRWYYWTNGSDTANGNFENGQATINITKLNDSQGTYIRYQPSGFNAGERYNISYKIMANVTTTLSGKKSIDVAENVWADFSYTGTLNSSEPFNITVKNVAIPSSGAITIKIKDITVTKAHAADYYEMEKGNNATVLANPGKWYFFTNGSDVATGYYESAQVHVSITKLDNEQGIYFRYQPGNDGTGLVVGDNYTLSLDVTMNITGKFTAGSSVADVITAGQFVTLNYEGTVGETAPFQMILKDVQVPTSGAINVTIKNITITKQLPPPEGYDVVFGNKATVVANPGKWYYCTNSGDAISSARYEEDMLTAHITALASSEGIFFRYQPGGDDGSGVNVGNTYTISFKIMLNVTTTIKGVKNVEVTENEWADYSYTGTVSATDPFFFTVKDTTIPESGSIDVFVKEVSVVKEHSADYYALQKGNNATCVANPGIWYYWTNGSSDSVIADKTYYEDDQVHISIDHLTHADGIYFRYQPGGDDETGLVPGDQFSISLQITMNIAGTFTGRSSATVTTPGTFVTYSYSGEVRSDQPFNITLKGVTVPASGSIDVTIKDIVISKVAPDPGDEERIEMPQGNMATVKGNPGIWYYFPNGGDAIHSAYIEDDIINYRVKTITSSGGVYLRYQPGGDDGSGVNAGDTYKVTLKITMNVAGSLTYSGYNGTNNAGISANVETAGEFITIVFTGVVGDPNNGNQQPFQLNFKKDLMPASGTLDIQVKEISVAKVEAI